MYRKEYQKGFLSVFSSLGSSPLKNWETKFGDGCIERVTDETLKSLVLELTSCNISTTFITCPKEKDESLGIRMPICTFNWKAYEGLDNFAFEIMILDDKNLHRRFRFSNFVKIPRIRATFFVVCPIKKLPKDWASLRFDLCDMTRRAFCSTYIETVRIQVNANCRLKAIYFTDILYSEDDTPNEFKLRKKIQQRKVYIPFQKKRKSAVARPATPDSSGVVPWIQELRAAEEMEYNQPHPSVASSEYETYTLGSEEEASEAEKIEFDQTTYDEEAEKPTDDEEAEKPAVAEEPEKAAEAEVPETEAETDQEEQIEETENAEEIEEDEK